MMPRARVTQSQFQKKPKAPRPLEEIALQYLNRFDCTEAKLKRYLLSKLAIQEDGDVPEAMAAQVDALLERYRNNGLLNDTRYAEVAIRRWSERGLSGRRMAAKLGARGLKQEVVSGVLQQRAASLPEAELGAARALVRRRRLGFYRPEIERKAFFRKDLAVLARAGFSFDVARRALEAEEEEAG